MSTEYMKLDNTQSLSGFLTSGAGKPFRGLPLDSLNLAVAALVRRASTVDYSFLFVSVLPVLSS